MAVILLIGLVVLMFAMAPAQPNNWRWRSWPLGLIAALLIVVLAMGVFEVIPWGWPTGY